MLDATNIQVLIEKLKTKFPKYTYHNGLRDEFYERDQLSTHYCIVIKDVPTFEQKELYSFIDSELFPIAGKAIELPMVVVLH